MKNHIKFSKMRDPITEALNAAIMGKLPY
jgi:hypothetical protein